MELENAVFLGRLLDHIDKTIFQEHKKSINESFEDQWNWFSSYYRDLKVSLEDSKINTIALLKTPGKVKETTLLMKESSTPLSKVLETIAEPQTVTKVASPVEAGKKRKLDVTSVEEEQDDVKGKKTKRKVTKKTNNVKPKADKVAPVTRSGRLNTKSNDDTEETMQIMNTVEEQPLSNTPDEISSNPDQAKEATKAPEPHPDHPSQVDKETQESQQVTATESIPAQHDSVPPKSLGMKLGALKTLSLKAVRSPSHSTKVSKLSAALPTLPALKNEHHPTLTNKWKLGNDVQALESTQEPTEKQKESPILVEEQAKRRQMDSMASSLSSSSKLSAPTRNSVFTSSIIPTATDEHLRHEERLNSLLSSKSENLKKMVTDLSAKIGFTPAAKSSNPSSSLDRLSHYSSATSLNSLEKSNPSGMISTIVEEAEDQGEKAPENEVSLGKLLFGDEKSKESESTPTDTDVQQVSILPDQEHSLELTSEDLELDKTQEPLVKQTTPLSVAVSDAVQTKNLETDAASVTKTTHIPTIPKPSLPKDAPTVKPVPASLNTTLQSKANDELKPVEKKSAQPEIKPIKDSFLSKLPSVPSQSGKTLPKNMAVTGLKPEHAPKPRMEETFQFAKPAPIVRPPMEPVVPVSKPPPPSLLHKPIKNPILLEEFYDQEVDMIDHSDEAYQKQQQKPAGSTLVDENGEIPDIDTDEDLDSSGDEALPNHSKPPLPEWAVPQNLTRALVQQRTIDPDSIFGTIITCDLEDIFKGSSNAKKFKKRSSSANWSGVDQLTQYEELQYKKRMGYI